MSKERETDFHDFNVVKEYWNRYQIEDGSELRFKMVLIFIKTPKGVPFKQGAQASMLKQDIAGVIPAPELVGEPDIREYSNPDLEQNIREGKDDLKFQTISENWNEYFFSNDNVVMSLKPAIALVSQTTKYNSGGDPIYYVRSQPLIKIRAVKT